jgi:hypothetical protein
VIFEWASECGKGHRVTLSSLKAERQVRMELNINREEDGNNGLARTRSIVKNTERES